MNSIPLELFLDHILPSLDVPHQGLLLLTSTNLLSLRTPSLLTQWKHWYQQRKAFLIWCSYVESQRQRHAFHTRQRLARQQCLSWRRQKRGSTRPILRSF